MHHNITEEHEKDQATIVYSTTTAISLPTNTIIEKHSSSIPAHYFATIISPTTFQCFCSLCFDLKWPLTVMNDHDVCAGLGNHQQFAVSGCVLIHLLTTLAFLYRPLTTHIF
jgi:hypothetical protein